MKSAAAKQLSPKPELIAALEAVVRETDGTSDLLAEHDNQCRQCSEARDMDDYCDVGRAMADAYHGATELLQQIRKPARRARR